jgi:hypothetical protein
MNSRALLDLLEIRVKNKPIVNRNKASKGDEGHRTRLFTMHVGSVTSRT